MKKILALSFVLIVLLVSLTSCFSENNTTEIPSTSKHDIEVFPSKGNIEEIKQTNKASSDGIGGASITTRKYRDRYYSVPYQFAVLVGLDTYWEWDSQYGSEEYAANDKMVIKEFVQHFNISREDFDKANLEFAKIVISGFGGVPVINPKDFANQEIHEIYNADIIFTFDDTIINEYYLSPDYPYLFSSEYDEAVEKGEYSSQTEVWVDIEQMEAEIIAKYGEAEQVEYVENEVQTTEVAGIPEEITLPEQTEAVTTA